MPACRRSANTCKQTQTPVAPPGRIHPARPIAPHKPPPSARNRNHPQTRLSLAVFFTFSMVASSCGGTRRGGPDGEGGCGRTGLTRLAGAGTATGHRGSRKRQAEDRWSQGKAASRRLHIGGGGANDGPRSGHNPFRVDGCWGTVTQRRPADGPTLGWVPQARWAWPRRGAPETVHLW